MKISLIVTMNIFNDITVHAASFELESHIYFLDDFRQKRPLWQKEGEKMEEKKRKKSFFPRENWRQDTIILVMNISFLVWTSQRSRNVKQLDGATIKLIFYTTLSRYKHPVDSVFLQK